MPKKNNAEVRRLLAEKGSRILNFPGVWRADVEENRIVVVADDQLTDDVRGEIRRLFQPDGIDVTFRQGGPYVAVPDEPPGEPRPTPRPEEPQPRRGQFLGSRRSGG